MSVIGRLGRRALLAASYLEADRTPLPFPNDKRAEERLRLVLETATRGVRRDLRRYRLALYALGKKVPIWARRRP